MFSRISAFFTALVIFFTSLFSGTSPKFAITCPETYENAITEQTGYVLSLLQADDSLPMTYPNAVDPTALAANAPDWDGVDGDVYKEWKSSKVCPYFSCFALTGLIEASPDLAREAAEKYIIWHFSHLNTAETDYSGIDGTIFDYRVFVNPSDAHDTVCVPISELLSDETLAYDSTDSYGAMFLKLLYTYGNAYPQSDFLDAYKTDIERVINAMLSTYIPFLGITYAKPTYKICYLMDNCEVYEGLICASRLYSDTFDNGERSKELSRLASSVKRGIQTVMYNCAALAYYASVSTSGLPSSSVSSSALANFYPDATAQLFPIICGVVGSDSLRALNIYTQFNTLFGTDELGKSWQSIDVGSSFPWALIVRAAVIMNDSDRTEQYFDSLTKYSSNGFKYPYYCAEAGHVLSAAAQIQRDGIVK